MSDILFAFTKALRVTELVVCDDILRVDCRANELRVVRASRIMRYTEDLRCGVRCMTNGENCGTEGAVRNGGRGRETEIVESGS